jgi:hypothetical protein
VAAIDLVNSIRERGFRKWYERQLVESHLYLITCFLCMVLVAACAEELSFRAPGLKPVLLLGCIGGGGLLGLLSWKRYKAIMSVAEHYGDHSTCAACGAYARFEIVDWGDPAPAARTPEGGASGAGTWLKVRCRKCGHDWTMA